MRAMSSFKFMISDKSIKNFRISTNYAYHSSFLNAISRLQCADADLWRLPHQKSELPLCTFLD
jgi:hypothetical protein